MPKAVPSSNQNSVWSYYDHDMVIMINLIRSYFQEYKHFFILKQDSFWMSIWVRSFLLLKIIFLFPQQISTASFPTHHLVNFNLRSLVFSSFVNNSCNWVGRVKNNCFLPPSIQLSRILLRFTMGHQWTENNKVKHRRQTWKFKSQAVNECGNIRYI